nr:reverse transcriptase domain-containing protein [Tanacetum cinerariifolium]
MLLNFSEDVQDTDDEDREVDKTSDKGKTIVADDDLREMKDKKEEPPQRAKIINMVRCHTEDMKRKNMLVDEEWMNFPIIFPPVFARDLSKEAIVIEAKVEGYLVWQVHVDDGASIKIMYEHCFNNLHPSIKARMTEMQTTVSWFSGEQVKPLGKIELEVCFGGSQITTIYEHRRSEEEIRLTEKVLVNPAYPDQLVTIERNLSQEGSAQLKTLIKRNHDIFAWELSDMTGVPRRIIKHLLNANPSVTLIFRNE